MQLIMNHLLVEQAELQGVPIVPFAENQVFPAYVTSGFNLWRTDIDDFPPIPDSGGGEDWQPDIKVYDTGTPRPANLQLVLDNQIFIPNYMVLTPHRPLLSRKANVYMRVATTSNAELFIPSAVNLLKAPADYAEITSNDFWQTISGNGIWEFHYPETTFQYRLGFSSTSPVGAQILLQDLLLDV